MIFRMTTPRVRDLRVVGADGPFSTSGPVGSPIGGRIAAMRVLMVGGAGYVAGLVLPSLAGRHAVRVLDRRRPPDGVEWAEGSATDYAALRRAAAGTDAVVHCAMGDLNWDSPDGARDAFDVNVTSVHLTLRAAHDAGVAHAVHISSLSVYRDLLARRVTESDPPDATDVYGLSVNILRLAFPAPDDVWPAWGPRRQPQRQYADDGTLIEATAASDLGSALLAALAYRDGCQVFTIS